MLKLRKNSLTYLVCFEFSCCSSSADDEFHGEGDNSCGWNMVSVKKQTSLANSDFVYASFKTEVYVYMY